MKKVNLTHRDQLADSIASNIQKYPNLVVLDADLSNSSGFNLIAEQYSDYFYNTGIQEANMIGIAAGLASEGFIPFTHTFAAFASRRVLDQIFVSVIYNQQAVKMVASDPGIINSANGATHLAFDDVGIMSSLPNIKILDFSDGIMIKKLLPQIIADPFPYYIRIERKSQKQFYDMDMEMHIGKANVLGEGDDFGIICNSSLALEQGFILKEKLEKAGKSVRLIDMFTLAPLDEEEIIQTAHQCTKLITIENSSKKNGLATMVSEVLFNQRIEVELMSFGIPHICGEVGTKDFLLKKYGMDADSILECIKE